jgi:hypothetical protein
MDRTLACEADGESSNLSKRRNRWLAQLAEHFSYKEVVKGSIPLPPIYHPFGGNGKHGGLKIRFLSVQVR